MTIQFYMDVHIRRSITEGLRRIGLDVLTAQEDRCAELSDPDLLDRATQLGRVLFSMDDDLLTEATRRQNENVPFAGVIYAHQLRITVGQSVRDLSLIAEVYDVTDIANRVEFLPL
jgi:predicted nuclease of predicted toxin-antitoxin system